MVRNEMRSKVRGASSIVQRGPDNNHIGTNHYMSEVQILNTPNAKNGCLKQRDASTEKSKSMRAADPLIAFLHLS